MNTVTYFEFVSHVLPVVYEHFRGSGAGTGVGPGAGVGTGAAGEVEMMDRVGRAADDVVGDNETASLSTTSTSLSVAVAVAVGALSTAADMPLNTSRATTAAETGTGTWTWIGKIADSGVRTERQSEILQVLEGDLETVQSRSTSNTISMGMNAEGVTGTDSSSKNEKAAISHRQESAFDDIPEHGVYDVTVEGDEEASDTFRNMLAVLPPPQV